MRTEFTTEANQNYTLASMVSHELKNTLQGIIMQLELFKRDLVQDYQLKINNIIKATKDGAEEASHILSTFKNLSENKTDKSKFQKYSIEKAIEDAIKMSDTKDISISFSGSDFKYFGDHLLTTHVIHNIIKNAIHELRRLRVESPTIKIQIHKNFITITDNGDGIEPDRLKTIFDPFKSTSIHGIGLTYCKEVIESYGGLIQCASKKGETTFKVIFQEALTL